MALARAVCPGFEKITMGMHYYGIMCNDYSKSEALGYSDTFPGPGWLKVYRDAWIKQYCNRLYEYCPYYKAAREAEAKAEKRKTKKTKATASKRKV